MAGFEWRARPADGSRGNVLLSNDPTTVYGLRPGRNRVTLAARDNQGGVRTASVTVDVRVATGQPANVPPVGIFSMSVPGQIALSGAELRVVAEAATGQARVTFVDLSTDTDGTVDGRVWRAHTQAEPLSIDDTTFTWGFTPGRYIVSLTVTDNDGAMATTSAVVEVLRPTPTLYHSDSSPFVYFGTPVIDSEGALYLPRQISTSTCSFGICDLGLQRIAPDGSGWIRDGLGADPFASQRLTFGPDGRVYFQAVRSTLFAFRPDGSQVPGWPVRITDHSNPSFRAMLVDDDTGQVHLSAAGAFVSDPTINVSLNPDGSEAWRVPPEEAGAIFRGPGGDVYVVGESVRRLDRRTGSEQCRAAPQAFINLGTPVGLFGSANSNELHRTTGDCSTSLFYTWQGSSISVGTYVPGASPADDRVIGSAAGGTIMQPTSPRLVGLNMSGSLVWMQDEIELSPSTPIRAARDGVLYVLGDDRNDSLRQKLFFVDALTGRIDARIDTTAICNFSCNVGVGPNRRVVIADGNRIYEVR
jgi:hypothetical protein